MGETRIYNPDGIDIDHETTIWLIENMEDFYGWIHIRTFLYCTLINKIRKTADILNGCCV